MPPWSGPWRPEGFVDSGLMMVSVNRFNFPFFPARRSLDPSHIVSLAGNEAFYTGKRGFQKSDTFLALPSEMQFKTVTFNFLVFFFNSRLLWINSENEINILCSYLVRPCPKHCLLLLPFQCSFESSLE